MIGVKIVEGAGLIGIVIGGVYFNTIQVGVGDLPRADDSVLRIVDVSTGGASSRIAGDRQNGAKADDGDDGDDAFHKVVGLGQVKNIIFKV